MAVSAALISLLSSALSRSSSSLAALSRAFRLSLRSSVSILPTFITRSLMFSFSLRFMSRCFRAISAESFRVSACAFSLSNSRRSFSSRSICCSGLWATPMAALAFATSSAACAMTISVVLGSLATPEASTMPRTCSWYFIIM